MSGLYDRVQGAAQFLSGRGERPRAWIILGTGLGGLAGRIEGAVPVPYEEIPHFPRSTSPGHSGELILGRLQDVPVAAMAGRCHYYEGYSMEEVTLPVRVARALGAAALLVTSAVGGLDPEYRTGDLFAVEDHLNLMGDTPLRGPNDDRLGIRFPDMKVPYDPVLLDRAQAVAGEHGFPLRRGVLAAVGGPQLESRAAARCLRTSGADA
ncbi:MAG: purine-nucleoside phosphorylase, partial [Planctomycetota bacterium]